MYLALLLDTSLSHNHEKLANWKWQTHDNNQIAGVLVNNTLTMPVSSNW